MKKEGKNNKSQKETGNNTFRIEDFDDIVFRNRNKEYGAYQIRKKYNRTIVTAIILSSLIMTAVIVIPFLNRPSNERILSGGMRYATLHMENFEPPPEEIYIPTAPPPPPAERAPVIVKYVPPVVVDSITPVELAPLSTDEVLAGVDEAESEVVVYGTGTGSGNIAGYGNGETDEPFFIVEVMPLFRGGDLNKFREWVQKRTNYPQEAIEKKIKGRVFLTFIVEPDGSVTNVTVVKGVAPVIDNEAVKAIEASPKWSPGLQRGQPVRVRFSMWLNFVF